MRRETSAKRCVRALRSVGRAQSVAPNFPSPCVLARARASTHACVHNTLGNDAFVFLRVSYLLSANNTFLFIPSRAFIENGTITAARSLASERAHTARSNKYTRDHPRGLSFFSAMCARESDVGVNLEIYRSRTFHSVVRRFASAQARAPAVFYLFLDLAALVIKYDKRFAQSNS